MPWLMMVHILKTSLQLGKFTSNLMTTKFRNVTFDDLIAVQIAILHNSSDAVLFIQIFWARAGS